MTLGNAALSLHRVRRNFRLPLKATFILTLKNGKILVNFRVVLINTSVILFVEVDGALLTCMG